LKAQLDMSHLGKLKPSQLYIYDRLSQDKNEADERSRAGMEDGQRSGELTQHFKIQLKDDGLGKYKISPLGGLKDPNEMVRSDCKICQNILKFFVLTVISSMPNVHANSSKNETKLLLKTFETTAFFQYSTKRIIYNRF